MSEIQAPYRFLSLTGRKMSRDGTIGLVVLLALLLAIAAISLALLSRDSAEPFVLTILTGLAVIGVFALFAGAVGILHFGERVVHQDDLTKAYADNLSEGLLITRGNGHVLYANEAYFRFFTNGDSDHIPTVEQAFAGDVLISDHIFRLSRAALRGEAWEEEFRIQGSMGPSGSGDGGSRWFRISVDQMPGESSHARGPLSVWRIAEITGERMRQEEAFQKLQEAIAYLDDAPVGFFSADPRGRIDYMNATLAEWLGLDLTAIADGGLTLSELVSGNGAALLARAVEETGGSGTQELDIDLIQADGTSLPVRLLHRVVPAAGGAVQTRTMVLNRSHGAEMAEDVRAAEVRFARFFHSAPIAIATVNSEGRIGGTNAAFARMFNRSRSGMMNGGVSIYDLADASDRDALEKMLQAAAAGQVDIAPVDITLDAEAERNGRLFVSPIDQAAGSREAAILYAIETTEQKSLEIQVAQSQKMQAVGQLAGGIAHDFNNVLTAIIGFSDLLLASHRPTDPAFKDIMNIKQNANRAASLVRQLLAFSRQQTLRPEVLSLTDVLSDLSILLSRLLGEKVELKVVHGRDLWFVKADVTQFQQVIVNLCVNARDAMSDGGRLTIHTANVSERDALIRNNATIAPGEYVLLEVTDTGCGIPQELLEKIFEPFFTTKEVGKGTGLGLSTVYGIVKQTGGYIFPESEPGQGTTFRIFLPRHVEEEEEATGTVKTDKRDKPRDLTGSGCVLLVEDEEAVRSFAARALASRGYQVLEASTGIEALDMMEAHDGRIDLVVSDVVMPEMDGPTLLKELRKSNPELKIIFISGYAEDAFKKNLEEDEEFAFLPKPFSLKQLAAAVKETLQT